VEIAFNLFFFSLFLFTDSDLEECLLVMPFDQVLQFLRLAQTWLEVHMLACMGGCGWIGIGYPRATLSVLYTVES